MQHVRLDSMEHIVDNRKYNRLSTEVHKENSMCGMEDAVAGAELSDLGSCTTSTSTDVVISMHSYVPGLLRLQCVKFSNTCSAFTFTPNIHQVVIHNTLTICQCPLFLEIQHLHTTCSTPMFSSALSMPRDSCAICS